jgi:hypothetical protein
MMARHLTDASIASICVMIDGWERGTPLTWDNLVTAVEGLLGHCYTRQALNAHERIRTAYMVRRNVLKNLPEWSPKGSVELQAAQGRIDRVTAENNRLQAENERILGQFVRWLYNASIHGMTKDMLNQALPEIDRDRTRPAVIEDIRKQSRKKGRA